jgi:hypothetical protein
VLYGSLDVLKRILACVVLIGAPSLSIAQPKPKALRRATSTIEELPSSGVTRAAPPAGLPRLARDPSLDADRISAITYDLASERLGKRTKPPGIRLTNRLGVSVKKKGVMLGRRF